MPVYSRGLVLADVAQLHRLWQQAIAEAERANRRSKGGAANIVRLLKVSYRKFNRDLDELARVTSVQAVGAMQQRLDRTERRRSTGIDPHLRDHLEARPLDAGVAPFATGAVGIGDEAVLDKLVDPLYPADGPYWRTQEFGTRAHIGRRIRGYFFDPGGKNPTAPARGYTGNKQIAQPLFVPGRPIGAVGGIPGGIGPRGGRGGKGTIRQPIRARHFIRDGSKDAEGKWRAGLQRIERESLVAIEAAFVSGQRQTGRRRR